MTRHVRGVLELPEDVELERAAARSAKRHRQFVRDRLQVAYEPARVRGIAEEAIRKAVQTKDNPADLINVASSCRVPRPRERRGRSAVEGLRGLQRGQDVDGLLTLVSDNVDWPDGAKRLRGRAAVRQRSRSDIASLPLGDSMTDLTNVGHPANTRR